MLHYLILVVPRSSWLTSILMEEWREKMKFQRSTFSNKSTQLCDFTKPGHSSHNCQELVFPRMTFLAGGLWNSSGLEEENLVNRLHRVKAAKGFSLQREGSLGDRGVADPRMRGSPEFLIVFFYRGLLGTLPPILFLSPHPCVNLGFLPSSSLRKSVVVILPCVPRNNPPRAQTAMQMML